MKSFSGKEDIVLKLVEEGILERSHGNDLASTSKELKDRLLFGKNDEVSVGLISDWWLTQ